MFGAVTNPRQRIEVLASLAGIKVAPMQGSGIGAAGAREALVYSDTDGSRRAFYNPTYSDGRVNFSIAHEIVHSFFPNSARGARFRTLSAEGSREANELERLCDLGAAELLMPADEFLIALDGQWGLANLASLCDRFGSSYEATVYRLATTSPNVALAGLLQYRRRKDEERTAGKAQQQNLFGDDDPIVTPTPKYRRQSLHMSDSCNTRYTIPWNKSFDVESLVYRATEIAQCAVELLPNATDESGDLEVIIAPYQRAVTYEAQPDVLFLWRQKTKPKKR
jgi:Zn-dependent peptidase ImmA (M78 family)